MVVTLYYLLAGLYTIALLISAFYHLGKKPPGGDASVGWAWGIIYTAGLACILLISILLRQYPAWGVLILCLPVLLWVIPFCKGVWMRWYIHFPERNEAPPLALHFENRSGAMVHIKVDCWFGKKKSDAARLFTTFHYYLKPFETIQYQLNTYQTRLLAHKSKFVSLTLYKQIQETAEGHSYLREIQPGFRNIDEKPMAFQKGSYSVIITETDVAKSPAV